MGTVSVQLGLLAIAKDPATADLGDVDIATERASTAGHRVLAQHTVSDNEDEIRAALEKWIADPTLDVIIVLGGADSDAVSNAMRPLVGHVLPGFTDLFRYLFFQEAGASAMLSAAEAARCSDTFVFVLPGAVAAAMDQLIIPQFDPATTPKNLVGQMPRLRAERENTPVPTTDEESAGHGVPREVAPEKTQGGSGVAARLPAIAAPRRDQKRTGANVISRNAPPVDPQTKPIDLARLEQEIAASQAKEDVTRRTDLQKLLPRVPPGADDLDDDFTHADIIAAPPAKSPFTIPAIGKPATVAKITPVAKPVERVTPMPIGKTPLPSITKTAPVVAKPEPEPAKPIEAMPAAVTIQPRKRESEAKPVEKPPTTKPVEKPAAKSNGKHAPSTAADEAPTILRPSAPAMAARVEPAVDEAAARADEAAERAYEARALVEAKAVDEAKTMARPAVSPRSSGAFGVLSDSDLEPVDGDDSGDLDAIRAAATAQSDEAPTVRAEPVRVKMPTAPPVTMISAVPPAPAPAPVRTRPPTPPPPPKVTTPPVSASATDAPRARPATVPPPPRTTSELPRGTFNYPTQRKGMHWALKLVLVLVVLGAGFGGFLFFFRDKLTGEQAANSGTGSAVEIDAAVIAAVEIDAAVIEVDAAPEPEIEMTPTPVPTGSATPRPPRGGERPPRGGERPPKNPPPDKLVDAGVAALTPPTGPSNTPPGAGDDDCDETACVLSRYEKPCCAKFKPAESSEPPRAGGVPDTLDKAMVRAGVNGVKPKVQKCGEKVAAKGTVKVSMTISPEGAVTEASLADSPDPALGDCVVAAMKLAKFGKSVNGATFTYPFVF